MAGLTLDDAAPIVGLAMELVPRLEVSWGCIINVDLEVLQEAAGRAMLTIEHVGMEQPNEIKQAGHYAFWIRKLKPLTVVDLNQLKEAVDELAEQALLKGKIEAVQGTVPPSRRRFVNEMFALLSAIGIAKAGNYNIEMTSTKLHDLAVNLRYHSFSPSALSSMLMAFVK